MSKQKPKLKEEVYCFFDFSMTKIVVDEQGIGSRKRIAEQHVTISRPVMSKLLEYFIVERLLDNKVNINV